MAFWGVEVKPGKPVTHSCEKARGRLRISQATLGISEATKKTIVQCNVGNRSPVLLCVLLPNKTESCHLDLEFEEADDVVFSVIGPRSVYLTGYYVLKSQQSNPHSDTESYGVDIENTPSEGSSYRTDDDKYDDSFINDDELQVSPNSPNNGMDEDAVETDKPKSRKGRGKQLKKKYRVIESDNDVNSHESEDEDEDEDEDAYSLSFFKNKRAAETTIFDAAENIAKVTVEMGDEAKDDGVCGSESKHKADPSDINDKLERETKLPLDEGVEVKFAIPKEVKTLEEIIVSNAEVLAGETTHGNNAKDTITDQNLLMRNEKDEMQSLDLAKPKKKRKQHPMKEEKACKVQNVHEDQTVLKEDTEHQVEASTDLEIAASFASPVNGHKSKKRRNALQLEGTHTEGNEEKYLDILKDDKHELGLLHADSVTKDLPAANGESHEQQKLEVTSAEGIGAKCPNMSKEDKRVEGLLHADSMLKLVEGFLHADTMMKDLPAANGEGQEQQIDNNISTSQNEKKIKKKKKKAQAKKDLNTVVAKMTDNEETTPMKYEDQTTNGLPIQKRTLSNGLIIEELATGPPDGKLAVPGKKVKIYYTAMLKESGIVFDTNVGKTAFKFRLGDEELIDGWNVGIDGMHVGDKRRLIVPPSMGFGDHGMGENVPPNSWLVYDIELVGVRK